MGLYFNTKGRDGKVSFITGLMHTNSIYFKVFMWSSQWESTPQPETSPTPSTNDTSNNLDFLSQASAVTGNQPLGQSSVGGLLAAGLMDGVDSSQNHVVNNATNNDSLNAAGSNAMEWTDAADQFFSQNIFFDNQTDNTSGGNTVGSVGEDSEFSSGDHNSGHEIGAADDQYLNSVLGTTNHKSATETASGLINKLLQFKEGSESTVSSTEAANASNSKVDNIEGFSTSDHAVKSDLLNPTKNEENGVRAESKSETFSNIVKVDGVLQGTLQGDLQINGVPQGSVHGIQQNNDVSQGSLQGILQNNGVRQGSNDGVLQNNGVLQGSLVGDEKNNPHGTQQGSELNFDKLTGNASSQDISKAVKSTECSDKSNGESVEDTKSHYIHDLEDAKSPLTCDENSGCSGQTAATINNIRSSIDSEMSSSGGSTTALADTAAAHDFPDFDSDLLNEVKQLLPGVLQVWPNILFLYSWRKYY